MAKSKFLKLQNTKLSDYIEVRTNRVLQIDDISGNFSSSDDNRDNFSNVLTIDPNNNFNRFLVQVTSNDGEHSQLTEIVTLNDDSDIINLVKNTISPTGSEEIISNLEAITDSVGNFYLQFDPLDPNDKDYYIKVIQNRFLTKSTGINTVSVGFVDLLSYTNLVSSGSSVSFFSFDKNQYSSVYATVNLIDSSLDFKNYVELHVTHDGTNSYITEWNFDDVPQYNGRFIGTFTSYIQGDTLRIDYINDIENPVYIRCKNIGFGSTSVGVGTYRFKSLGQPDESERTCIYESEFYSGSSSSPVQVFSMRKDLFTSCKSLVTVDCASETSKSLHELSVIHDGTNINVSQFPFVSVGSTSGIGTFGGEYSGNQLVVKFYPDSGLSGITTVLSYNEKIYKNFDENIPEPLNYLPSEEFLTQTTFFGKNLDTINRKEFGMYYNGIPIFSKTFNPSNTSILDKETGIFKIDNHFFSNLERLIYTPKSTFEGIDASPIGIGETLNSVGVLTTKLPEEVYVIKLNTDQFKLSTRKDYAEVGIYVTFTDSGSGNAHELEMYKKNEKSLVAVNDIIQYPLSYSSLEFNLFNNIGGQIGAGTTIFSLSGISSINPKDLLKIEDEYVFVNNVGLGTTSSGPITYSGNFFLIDGVRGAVGTSATSHLDGTSARIYRGSYNIVGNEINFAEPPRGSAFFIEEEDFSNLTRAKATFNGRVFLRKNYESNQIYDDISERFDGLSTDYEITVQGISTVGLGSDGGNGILLINGFFQTPTTETNPGNNFFIIEDEVSGVSTVSFTGIITSTGEIEISLDDVNKNSLPRGGLIVSLGSTSGLGYAPLVGASVTAVVSSGSIVGITTNIEFGSYGSGYRSPVTFSIEEDGHSGSVADIDVVVGVGGTLSFIINNGGTGYSNPKIIIEPPNYENLEVIGVSRLGIGQTTETGIGLRLNVDVQPSAVKITGVGADVNVLGIPTTTGGRFADAASLIDRNKRFIANEAVNRMIVNYGGYPGPGTSTDCEDDVVGVLTTINYNLQYGGNDLVYEAAKIYIDNPYLQGEEVESIYTFEQARDIAIQVMRNESVTVSAATTQYSQIFDTTIIVDPEGPPYCSDVASAITQFVGIVTVAIGQSTLPNKVISSPTLFEVKNFKIVKNGYAFRRGDVFKPVGLVTAAELNSPRNEFELTVVDVYNDSFALWNFGSLNFIDSVKNYQDGSRVRFPLFYNSQLLSFEKNSESAESQLIDMNSLLVIFINGVLQNPGEAYEFLGGTSFTFTTAPKPEDRIDIFFYIGTENEDSVLVDVVETLKVGDSVEVLGITDPPVKPQSSRYILDLSGSDKLQTSLYLGNGIDDVNYRPFNWIKQKRDLIINNTEVSKSRDSLEAQIYPTARIIKNFSSSDSEVFVESIDLFKYDNTSIPVNDINLAVYDESVEKVSAAATVLIGSNGQFSSLILSNVGQGYIGTVASFSCPKPYSYLNNGIFAINPGITSLSTSEEVQNALDSVTISGTIEISNGEIVEPASFIDLNVGSGYTFTNPPKVIIEPPEQYYNLTSNSSAINGLDVGITSIKLVNGIGVPKAIEFTVDDAVLNDLTIQGFSVGYPIYVYGTTAGNGITSIDTSDSDIIGISTVSVDNIYYVHSWNASTGIVTCNVLSTTSISGLPTSIQNNVGPGFGLTSRYYPVGRFSWGKISGITRTSDTPLAFNVKGSIISGLSTFPIIQRRGYGLRNNGSIKKSIL